MKRKEETRKWREDEERRERKGRRESEKGSEKGFELRDMNIQHEDARRRPCVEQ